MSYPSPSSYNETLRELPAEQVRWFYKSDADKQWLPFCGYDTLRIEEQYRQRNSFNQPSEDVPQPSGPHSASAGSSMDEGIFCDASSSSYFDTDDCNKTPPKNNIVVRGGMYEVDIEKSKCVSIFWPGEQCAITRGELFYHGSWQPVVEWDKIKKVKNVASPVANKHASPSNSKISEESESLSGFRIEWYSHDEAYLYSQATPSKLVRSFTQKLGYFQKSTGYRLHHGYKIPASHDDHPADVTHLVFVIHGIGQKMDKDRILRNTCTFRDCTSWLQTKYFPSSRHRAEFFPVEWRSSLKLDGGIVEAITPNKVQGIRQRLNATAMDIMYYTSPLYSQEIQWGLTCELNRLYSTFTQCNPDFTKQGGKVSVIAHSLGCVIVYDIITGWSITHTLEQRKAQESSNTSINGLDSVDAGQTSRDSNSPQSSQGTTPTPTPTHRPTKLLFELDNLFCMGSPLAVFLALRVRDPQAESCHRDLLPPSLCRRFFNVFHPSDPVAYRLEPLLVREYARVAPIQIQTYNSASHTLYSAMQLEPLVSDVPPTSSKQCAGGDEGDSPKSPGGTPSRERGWSLWSIVQRGWKGSDEIGSPLLHSPSQGLEHRLDYVLRDSNLGGPYISAVTSHTDYWRNYDVAYFVLTRLFPELEETSILSAATQPDVTQPDVTKPDVTQPSPQQQSPQQSTTSQVASPPLLQQMLSQVQDQAQSVLQLQAPSSPVPSPTLMQHEESNEAASR